MKELIIATLLLTTTKVFAQNNFKAIIKDDKTKEKTKLMEDLRG